MPFIPKVSACPTLGPTIEVSAVDHDAFPGIAVADDDTIIITYRQGAGHDSHDGVAKMVTSTDGGDTWSAPTTIYNDSSYDVRSTSLTKLASGRIVLVIHVLEAPSGDDLVDGGFTLYTDDAGDNWSTPQQIETDFTSVSRTEGTLAELADGSWLLGVFGRDTGDNPDDRTVRAIKTSDDGANWTTVGEIADGETDGRDYNGTGMVRDGSRVIAFVRENRPFSGAMWRSVSTDDGATWSDLTEVVIEGKELSGISNPFIRANGDLIIIWRDWIDVADNYPQTMYRSGDFGITWEPCRLLDGDRSVYGQAAEDSNRKLVLTWASETDSTATGDSTVYFAKETIAWHPPGSLQEPAAESLDELTDVTLTITSLHERLHYDGEEWVNTDKIWKPLLDAAGAIVTDDDGDPTMGLASP